MRISPLFLCVIFATLLSLMTATVSRHIIRSVTWPSRSMLPDIKDPALRKHWRTGDLIVFASFKGDAILINLASGVPWTHVGMLVFVPDEDPKKPINAREIPTDQPGTWFMWHSDAPSSRANAHSETDDDRHNGVQFVPLDYYLDTSESVAVHVPMPLNGGIQVPDLDTLTRQITSSTRHGRKHGFDDNAIRLVSVALSNSPLETYIHSTPDTKDKDGFGKAWFCSGFVSHVYSLWGWDRAGAHDDHAFHPKHYLVWRASPTS